MIALFYMPPSFSVDNGPCGVLAETKATPYIRLPHVGCAKASYFADIYLGYFCAVVSSSYRLVSATFADFILHIVRVRSEEQMFRVAAWWIIAAVENIHAVWNWAVRQNPRLTMCIPFPPRVLALSIFIARLCGSPVHPWPARILSTRFIDCVPEVLDAGVFNWKARRASALIMLATQSLRQRPSLALWCGASIARVSVGAYLGFSHIAVPSRVGQRRRSVCSGRRFAFMPHLVASAQGAVHG
jgi:hypothetical protein